MPGEIGAPDGRTWRVRRHWLPRLREDRWPVRFRRWARELVRDVRARDVFEGVGCVADLLEAAAVVAVGLAVVVLVLLLAFVVAPVVFALVDALVVLVLAGLGVLARVVLRRPWTVEALASDDERAEWKVVGFRASGALKHDLRARLEAGVALPGPDVPTGGVIS
jgi:hypothetical protein